MTQPAPAAPRSISPEQPEIGSVFVSNYPPFGAWSPENLPDVQAALDAPSRPGTPLGLYLHIPFCRKRCKFCYFRVYTDTNASDVKVYTEASVKEVEHDRHFGPPDVALVNIICVLETRDFEHIEQIKQA